LADLDRSVAGVGGGDNLPTVQEDDTNDVIDVCSELIRLAANKAKGFHTFFCFVIVYCNVYITICLCNYCLRMRCKYCVELRCNSFSKNGFFNAILLELYEVSGC